VVGRLQYHRGHQRGEELRQGLWRKVPFSAEIFDDKRDKLMANDNGWQFGYDIRGRPIRRPREDAQVDA